MGPLYIPTFPNGKAYVASSIERLKCAFYDTGRSLSAGTYFDKAWGRWMAYITVDRKTKILGRFDTQEQAKEARESALAALQSKRR